MSSGADSDGGPIPAIAAAALQQHSTGLTAPGQFCSTSSLRPITGCPRFAELFAPMAAREVLVFALREDASAGISGAPPETTEVPRYLPGPNAYMASLCPDARCYFASSVTGFYEFRQAPMARHRLYRRVISPIVTFAISASRWPRPRVANGVCRGQMPDAITPRHRDGSPPEYVACSAADGQLPDACPGQPAMLPDARFHALKKQRRPNAPPCRSPRGGRRPCCCFRHTGGALDAEAAAERGGRLSAMARQARAFAAVRQLRRMRRTSVGMPR